MWWEYALWGLIGAAANRGVVFLEACQRVKNRAPWALPHGPGGGMYVAATAVHLFLGAGASAALARADIVTNSFVAFGVGVGAVLVVKKAGTYATSAIPEGEDPGSPQRGDDDGT